MKLQRVRYNQYKRAINVRGSNQYKKRKKISPNGMAGAIFVLLIAFFALLHYTAIAAGVGTRVTQAWAKTTFILEASAPTVKTANAEEVITPTPTPRPSPTKKDIIYTAKHGDIIYRIYGLESSYGKQPLLYCTRQGKVSDMGYNALNKQCFDTFEDEVKTVDLWIDKHSDLSLQNLLCLYNVGNPKVSCEYAKNFINL